MCAVGAGLSQFILTMWLELFKNGVRLWQVGNRWKPKRAFDVQTEHIARFCTGRCRSMMNMGT